MIFEGRNRVTSGFRLPDRRNHNGIDVVGDDDRTVRATVSGTVGTAGKVPRGADRTWEWGNYVRINADDGTQHYFCHMADGSLRVRRGQRVAAGAPLGIMGNTGYSFGAHTHYEVRRNGKPINPAPYAGLENRKGVYTDTHAEEVKVMAMSTRPVRMRLGYMSEGDMKRMRALLQKKSIKWDESDDQTDGYLTTTPAVSKGDQVGIIALAEEMQIDYEPVCAGAADAQLRDKLAAAEKARDDAIAERDRANHNAGKYLQQIEAVKAAVGV